jgi:hypothetical protein
MAILYSSVWINSEFEKILFYLENIINKIQELQIKVYSQQLVSWIIKLYYKFGGMEIG